MQISITGHHVDITPALHDYVQQKVGRIEKHFDKISKAHVVLTVEKLQQKAEATVHIAGAEIFANAVSTDMYAAIDALADKLNRQILKHKEKHRSNHQPSVEILPE